MNREGFSSRLGFILVSAGCAIGLGNVWRFPFITGRYGGAPFVIIYLLFLILLGLPIMIAEFAVGRGSRMSVTKSFDTLEPPGTRWHLYKYVAVAGNFLLMMFYTVVSGWMPYYLYKMAVGGFEGASPDDVGKIFGALLSDPVTLLLYTIFVITISGGICYFGVEKGVERVTKWMMTLLFFLMAALAVNSVFLPGADAGLKYYLSPDFTRLTEAGIGEVVTAALGQAFFTLSLGIGALAIFGSYIDKEKSIPGEAILIAALDTAVALMSGLIIFPACFSYGVAPSSGPNLLFVSLPNIFGNMPAGRFWGALFFLFMTFASLSTVIAVFENLISSFADLYGASRQKIVFIGIPLMILLTLPCIFGFNIWSRFQPFGAGSGVLDLEDFILSNNILPIGSLIYILFCTMDKGWGWNNFLRETNSGSGARMPEFLKSYVSYVLPFAIIYLLLNGYYTFFVR